MLRKDRRVRQFRVLYRVFLLRVVDLELLSADADPTRLLGQFATTFASISFLFALPILLLGGGHLQTTDGWTTEHFFLGLTMTVAGLVTVLSWDSAYPDRRDVLVLAPLPVATSTLFLAKVAALFAGPLLAMVSLNIFSGLTWPLLFGATGGSLAAVRALLAYWMTLSLAGCFVVFAVLAVQGAAANLLPRQIFLRLSAPLQATAFCLLLSVFFLEPSLESPTALRAHENQRLLACLPSYWFLGLFQQFNGSMHPALEPLARRAWIGLAVATGGALAALMLSYFRMLPKIVEQPDIVPVTRGLRWSPRVGGSLGGAITAFSLRTLLRSQQHRMILSVYLGVGLAIVVGYGRTALGGTASTESGIGIAFLLASIVTMILTVLAMRVVASIPIELPANWIVRATQVRPAHLYERAVRVSWIVIGAMPLVLILAGGLVARYPWRPMAAHLVTMLLVGMLLTEVCLYGFEKIPFTCSYLPGKGRIHVAFWVGLLVSLRLITETARFEDRMLAHLATSVAMICVLAGAVAGMGLLREARRQAADQVLFDEQSPTEVLSLKLR